MLAGSAVIGRLWDRLDGRTGLAVVFGLALAAYWIEALAWPLQRGRDSWDYWLYWLQLGDSHPAISQVMLFRTPLTPIATGLPMSLGGAQLLEAVMSLIYASAAVAWAWAVRPFGRAAAAAVAALVLALQLPYAALFHLVSSDFLFGALVPLFAGCVVRAALGPTRGALVGVGLAAAALTLTRPAGQIVVVAAALAALVASGAWRARLGRLAVVVAAAVIPLLLWAGVNAVRYDDFTVVRGGKAFVPFFKVFGERRIDPANGPASRRLSAVVDAGVLRQPPFARRHVDAHTYFRGPSNFETIRLIALSDQEFGRASNYDVLYDASVEAIRKHPGWYVRSVASTFWDFVDARYALEPVRRARTFPPHPLVQYVNGKAMPTPYALSPLAQAARFGFVWCPTDEIDRCILHDPSVAFASPRDQRRYRELTNRVRDWNEQLPIRNGNGTLESKLATLSFHTPRSILWIVVGAIALVLRRPRGTAGLVVLLVAAALVLLVHALSQGPQTEFELPLAPLFVLVAIAALVAPRGSATVPGE